MASLTATGIAVGEFPGVKGNPVISHTRHGAELARAEQKFVESSDFEALTLQSLKLFSAWSIKGYTHDDIREIYQLCV
jgi:hypothetical protein